MFLEPSLPDMAPYPLSPMPLEHTYLPQSPMSDFGSPLETTSGGRGRSITGFGGPYEDAVRRHERNRPALTVPHITTTALQCGDSITASDHRDGSAAPERGKWTADEGP